MAITKLELTGGNSPFDPADPRTFPAGFSTFEDSVDTELAAQGGTASGWVIVETATGVWSADPPSRTVGQYPCHFVGWSDPADVTNGVTTPANIVDTDLWTQVSAP